MSTKTRIERLEQQGTSRWIAPFVVTQREGEPLEDAVLRALDGHAAPRRWKFLLVPEPMSEQEWTARCAPPP